MVRLIYQYFPRFMTGLCLVTRLPNDVYSYHLLTGTVVYPKHANQRLAKVSFFNLAGYVWFPVVRGFYIKKK